MADIIRFPGLNRHSSGRPFAVDERPMPMVPRRFAGQSDPAIASTRGAVDEYKPRPLADAPDGNVVLRAVAVCEEARRSGNAPLPDMAWVIRSAMPWIKRRGRKWSSLPELHRGLLDQHCAAGDPTASMFCDWVEGKHLDCLVHPTGAARSADELPSIDIQGGL